MYKRQEFVKQYRDEIDVGRFSLVIGDTLRVQLKLLHDGYANSLVGQRQVEIGEEAINALLSLKKGEAVPNIIFTGIDVVNDANVLEFMN